MSDLKLSINLLPKGAWGNNLRERLKKEEWNTLRNLCYERFNHRCAICGKRDTALDAHEVWEFDELNKTQTLTDIIALCPACHGVKHMRNSIRIGYGEQSKAHFMKINKCDQMAFAKYYTEAIFKFEEQNKILRWKLVADLDKFGGYGIELKEREIPLIVSPYAGVDWTTVRHTKIDRNDLTEFKDSHPGAMPVILRPSTNIDSVKQTDILKEAMYFVEPKLNALPPKICSIVVENYSGIITVVSDRINKIQWRLDDQIIESKFNISGNFTSKISVEDVKGKRLSFILFGSGGETTSLPFSLEKVV